MKKEQYIFIFISLIVSSCSSDILLTGEVYDSENTGKIYYTYQGENFDSTKYKLLNDSLKYLFKINTRELKRNDKIVFTSNIDNNKQFGCEHTIIFSEILNLDGFSPKYDTLYTDLMTDENCTMVDQLDAKTLNFDKFIGAYKMFIFDTTHIIKLLNKQCIYISEINKIKSNYTNTEKGYWSYDNYDKKLVFNIYQEENNEVGIKIHKIKEYKFDVINVNDTITFKSVLDENIRLVSERVIIDKVKQKNDKQKNLGKFEDDRDGKVYQTVKINKQIWMAENLAYYTNNGCLIYNNDSNNLKSYGYLYNLETAMNVCPDGWHLPTKEEFKVLLNGNNGSYKAFDALAQEGTTGFSVLPGGWYDDKEGFKYINKAGIFWSSTVDNRGTSWYLYINFEYKGGSLSGSSKSQNKNFGHSVRCIKD